MKEREREKGEREREGRKGGNKEGEREKGRKIHIIYNTDFQLSQSYPPTTDYQIIYLPTSFNVAVGIPTQKVMFL